jgi:hypothetical protein
MKTTNSVQQEIFNLLDNFETGEMFLKSLEEIKPDIELNMKSKVKLEHITNDESKFWVSVMVTEYCIQNKVSEDMLRFFLHYYSDVENSSFAVSCNLSSLIHCPTMNLELYKEIEKKVHRYEKSFLSQCENISIEIRKYIIEELKDDLDDGFILQGMIMKLEKDFEK